MTPPPMSDPTVESRLNTISASPPVPMPVHCPSGIRYSETRHTYSIQEKDEKPQTAPTSMVGQINAILQVRIANTPLASQGVTMMEIPSGGVIVYVGVNKYEGIEDVPSEDIKAAIRAAIAEWEKKYTPGLS